MTHSISDDEFAVLYITFCVARQPDCIMHAKNHTPTVSAYKFSALNNV
jgi:hypothetical protein